jgi:hypothetical protein
MDMGAGLIKVVVRRDLRLCMCSRNFGDSGVDGTGTSNSGSRRNGQVFI